MKRIAVLMLFFLMTLGSAQLLAQNAKKEGDNMSPKKEKRVEKKVERKELRKLEGNKVSTLSKERFAIHFGNIPNVKWTRNSDYDIADFMLKKHDMKAYFDADGELVGTIQPKTLSDLPDKGVKMLKEKYKGYKIGPIIYFNNNEDNGSPMILWGTEVLDRDNYFVELSKGADKIVVYVDPGGNVSFFKKL